MRPYIPFLVVLFAGGQVLRGDELLPGELPVALRPHMRYPKVRDIMAAAKQKSGVRPLMFARLYSDGNDHYEPKWSSSAKHLAFLQANPKKRGCKIVLFENHSDARPTVLLKGRLSYDHMFSWGIGEEESAEGAFVFASTANKEGFMEVYYGEISNAPIRLTKDKRTKKHPALRISAGETWIVYDAMGELELLKFKGRPRADKSPPAAEPVATGSMPAWRPAPSKWEIVYLKDKARTGDRCVYCVRTRRMDFRAERVVFENTGNDILRTPTWSPDGRHVAFLAKKTGASGADAGPEGYWRIVVVNCRSRDYRTVANRVVVEDKFASVGPAWASNSEKIYFFSYAHERDGYFPISWVNVKDGTSGQIEYPKVLTGANDLAILPTTAYGEIAFVGVEKEKVSLCLYTLILNKY